MCQCHVGGEGRLYLGMEAAPVGLGQVGEEDPQGVDTVRQLEQKQLDDEEADLGLIALVVPEGHAEDQSVQGHDVVFPDHAVHGVNALVDVAAAGRLAELVNQEVTKRPEIFLCYSKNFLS